MSVKRAADAVYTFRFIRILTKKWVDMEAYDLGIIDENGKALKKSRELKTQEEKNAYTTFHRLVFNIKRIIQKLPFGKSTLASYAAALFLLKESEDIPELETILESYVDELGGELPKGELSESRVNPGVYKLTEETLEANSAEIIPAGSKVKIEADAIGFVQGVEIYKGIVENTNLTVYVTQGMLK